MFRFAVDVVAVIVQGRRVGLFVLSCQDSTGNTCMCVLHTVLACAEPQSLEISLSLGKDAKRFNLAHERAEPRYRIQPCPLSSPGFGCNNRAHPCRLV